MISDQIIDATDWYIGPRHPTELCAIPSKGYTIEARVLPIAEKIVGLANVYHATLTKCEQGELIELLRQQGADIDQATLAWCMVSAQLLGSYASGAKTVISFRESMYFLGLLKQGSGRHAAILHKTDVAQAKVYEGEIRFDDSLIELLPYVLDHHGRTSRLDIISGKGKAAERATRKERGVFYTPGDVAGFVGGYIARFSADSAPVGSRPVVCDPACGTGVLLRACIRSAAQRWRGANAEELVNLIVGLDIDPVCRPKSAAVVAIEVAMRTEQKLDVWNIYCRTIKRHFVVDFIRDELPPLARSATAVIANPPYASVPASRALHKSIATVFNGASLELHAAFAIRAMRDFPLIRDMGMILPLSPAFSRSRGSSELRSEVKARNGRWFFSFFDREPHALFGETVKTRNCIILYSASNSHSVYTTALKKWRGTDRPTLLSTTRFVKLGAEINGCIPKIGSVEQAEEWQALKEYSHAKRDGERLARLEIERESLESVIPSLLRRGRPLSNNHRLLVSPTAYYYLGVFPRFGAKALGGFKKVSSSPFHSLLFHSEQSMWAGYALLSSAVAHRYWMISGDGFHVTSEFIEELPLWPVLETASHSSALAELGRALWGQVCESPNISCNAGSHSISYDHTKYILICDEINRAIYSITRNNDAAIRLHSA